MNSFTVALKRKNINKQAIPTRKRSQIKIKIKITIKRIPDQRVKLKEQVW